MRRFIAGAAAVIGVCATVPAHADVEILPTQVRDFVLPASFDMSEAHVQAGGAGATLYSNTLGEAESASCGIVIATDEAARLLEYRFADAPTACVGVLPHPDGGVFVRGVNPTAQPGEVTGFTAFIGPDDQEVWAVTDTTLVDAAPEPNGTGEFIGSYVSPHGAMAYSAREGRLLAFSVGQLTIGQDARPISQAHVINVESGMLRVSGQTFGQSGVGVVGGVATRSSDGHFLIYYFSSGDQGAFFYSYDGRNNISFFNPRGEAWDDRFVQRMAYQNDLLHLLWSPSNEPTVETRVTATTDSGAELWSATFASQYQFRNGLEVVLGPPVDMWVGAEHTAVLHQASNGALLLRVMDINGESGGVAALDTATEYAPAAIVNGPNGALRLVAYDEATRHVFEFEMAFEDTPDYDPDAGPYLGDVGIPADIGLSDILEAAGCCATVAAPSARHGSLWALFGVLAALVVRRRW